MNVTHASFWLPSMIKIELDDLPPTFFNSQRNWSTSKEENPLRLSDEEKGIPGEIS